MKRLTLLALLAQIALVLESSACYAWGMTAMAPMVLMLLVTETGLCDGWISAGVTGLLTGLVMDLCFGTRGFTYTIPLVIAGVASGMSRYSGSGRVRPAFVFPALGCVLSILYGLAVTYFTRNDVFLGAAFWKRALGSLLLTEVIAWPVYILLQKTLGRWANEKAGGGRSPRSVYFILGPHS